jgi:hydrogenase nickel incorporation protein HypA/HybF
MHELGVTRAVLQIVLDTLEDRHLSRAVGVTLTVGELRGFEEEWVQRYFTSAARGTKAQDATVTLVTVPSRCRCRRCGTEFRIDVAARDVARCPTCQDRDYELCAGKELMITGMEAV